MKNLHGNEKIKTNILFLLFVFLFVVSISATYGLGRLSVAKTGIQSSKAVFDFTNAKPLEKYSGQRYYLAGDWEFYYDQYILSDSSENHKMNTLFPVPASYAGHPLKSTPYEEGGKASYKAYIENLKTDIPLTIYIPNIACAYRVFLDGELVTESGVLQGDSSSWSTPSSVRQKVYVTPERHEVVIELSAENYSGLYLTPVITNFYSSTRYENVNLAWRYSMAGIIFYASVVLFCIVLFSKTRYFSPWLPFLFFCLVLRSVISSEGYIASQEWLFQLSYERMTLLIFASTFVIKLISMIYFKDELNLKFPIESIAFLSSVFLLVAIGVAFLPSSVYNNYYFLILQLFSTVADMYLMGYLCQSFVKGEKNALLFAIAYFFLLLGITVDALYSNGLLPTICSWMMPFGLMVFALMVTFVHAGNASLIYQAAQKAKELEREVEKANMSVMISQIQPHFLYNALNTIKSLIRRDPKTAEKAIIDFSYYLRGNMDSLSHTEPIPFEVELEHVKYYCNIELLRFADKLQVEYDIQESHFEVPTLSIQPLMENAIKHGVTKRAEGGFVKLSTYATEQDFVIVVEDNGIGFDPKQMPTDDGRSHVGLSNIQYRFKTMLSATMTIESQVDVGTKVCVYIPKKSKTNQA